MEDWERDFAAYVEGRRMALRGTAYLLCGDWHSADDLTQTALTRLYLVWRRIDRIRSIDAYVRQVLVRAYLDERRRPTGGTADVLAAARRSRRRRSLLTVAGAAVAAAAVLVGGSALLGPSSAAPTAGHPTPTAPAPPTVPGISPTQAKRIVELCAAGYDGGESAPGLQLYNAIKSPWGIRYLLYGPKTYISCLHATEGDWRVHGENGPTQWLRGPISVDWSIADGLVPYDKGPGVYSAEGRVANSVATIRVRYGSARVTVPAVNGTFEVSLSVPGPEIVTGSRSSSIEPYDASGHPLISKPAPTSGADQYDELRTCWVTPDGTVLPTRVPPAPGQKCKPAIRWR